MLFLAIDTFAKEATIGDNIFVNFVNIQLD